MKRALMIALLLTAIFAGPALQVLAASDWNLEQWPSRWRYILHILTSYPFGFFAVSIFAYSVAISPPKSTGDILRLVGAFAATFIVLVILFVVSWPLLFGIGDGGTRQMIGAGLCIIGALHALIGGWVNHLILRSGLVFGGTVIPAKFEIPAHVFTAALPVLFLNLSSTDIESAARLQLFGAWPALIALIPYAILIAIYAPHSTKLATAFLAIGLAAAPAYFVKAICDYHLPREQPLTWPVRVITHFDDTMQKQAAWGQFVGSIRSGAPFQLGKGLFRLSYGNLLHQAFTDDMTPSTPLQRLHLTVPMSTFELKPNLSSAPFVMLRMKRATDADTSASGPDNLTIPYQDLTLVLDYSGALIDPSQLDDLRRKTIAFVDSMRVEASVLDSRK